MAILICGILEYATSYIMEKLFNARWWDYSENKFNINGRVCLETIIPFGILGIILIYLINPFVFGNLIKIPENILNIIAISVLAIFAIDFIVSFKIISNVRLITRKFDKENPKDNTEEISKKVKEFLINKSVLSRRLVNAFPKLTAILKEQGEIIKQKTNEIKEEITSRANEVKEDITTKASEVREDLNDYANVVKEGLTQKAEKVRKNMKKGISKLVKKYKTK